MASRVRLKFLSLSLRRLRPRCHVLESKVVASLKMVMQGLQTAVLCLPSKSMFARPKMIVPSWPKIICPVADGKDVTTRGPSDLLLASFFQD